MIGFQESIHARKGSTSEKKSFRPFMSDVFVTKTDWLGCRAICLPGGNQNEGHKNQRWLSKLKFLIC